MIKNIFLDAGGVILDESIFEEKRAHTITNIIQGYNKNYSLADYWSDVDEAVYRYVPHVYHYILSKNIPSVEDYNKAKERLYEMRSHDKHLELMDGIKDFLSIFSEKFNICILGQYGKDFRDFLRECNILQYFAYSEIQDDYTITKPDPRYFEAILKNCSCIAGESIMIGDRIDKDIIPAKAVGMKTIRHRTGLHKNQEPRTPEEIPDLTVERLKDITIKTISFF